ncbi:MAG: transcription termination factor Rho [Akkermansia sp.]|nr:transcription termination factor Rho [Akkermansia sp.]
MRDAAQDASGDSPRQPNRHNRTQGHNKNNRFHKRAHHQARNKDNNTPNQEQNTGRAYVPVGEPEELTGLLEITNKGYGFIRVPENNWAPSDAAVYVSADIIAEHHLRPFVQVTGMAQKYERGHQLISVLKVNGQSPEDAANNPHFEDLKAVNPTQRLAFSTVANRYTTRTLDLVAPVARGQRGLIVAPPRTGKTTLLMHIAEGVRENYDDVHLMILLVDERPEEVTEFRRSLPGAEIFASSNDSSVREHCRMAEMCIERAKRLVEAGEHVLILMDSITRLARAYNNAERGSGRTMSGGIDARALETPRRLFAAARSTRNAGSLTILATALIETNSRMDELIFQEFKGTGNMELVLNRRIAEMYIYPAVDILKSGTRREELILPEWMLEKIRLIRRGLAGYKPTEAMERLLFFLQRYKTNSQMLMDIKLRN